MRNFKKLLQNDWTNAVVVGSICDVGVIIPGPNKHKKFYDTSIPIAKRRRVKCTLHYEGPLTPLALLKKQVRGDFRSIFLFGVLELTKCYFFLLNAHRVSIIWSRLCPWRCRPIRTKSSRLTTTIIASSTGSRIRRVRRPRDARRSSFCAAKIRTSSCESAKSSSRSLSLPSPLLTPCISLTFVKIK